MNASILSQVSYGPVLWMFNDRNVNKKIIKEHEELLSKIRQQNLKIY